jgi:hypothetical protein
MRNAHNACYVTLRTIEYALPYPLRLLASDVRAER